MRYNINKDDFVKVCNESLTMSEAAIKLNLHFNTFKKYALKFDCYNTNQGARGKSKNSGWSLIPLEDILNGKYPNYQTFKLKNRLLKENIKEYKCECCGLSVWNNLPIPLELHHKDGNRHNHKLNNLMLLCPNCHAQTETYRAKNMQGSLR